MRLRTGDTIKVTAIEQLAGSRSELRGFLSQLKEIGVRIQDERGETISIDWLIKMEAGLRALDNKMRRLSATEAARRGRLGGRPPRLDDEKARRWWFDKRLTARQALQEMPGWTKDSAYRKWGARGTPAGRPAQR